MRELFHAIGRIENSLERINEKLETQGIQRQSNLSLDVVTLLELSNNLRNTAMALLRVHKASAEQISKETQRETALETLYLNQLTHMGYIRKCRKGQTIYFYLPM